jgi:(1->4)-alpha-D-glucan 1-alpha-D-glucosylmutase
MAGERPARVPVSTYRLQLHRGFGFRDAQALIPYLAALGVTECYLSPVLAARPESEHGYDIVDHSRLNAELGAEEDFHELARTLASHGMGVILDFVPNHMAADPAANPLWRDVLENGPSALSARFFDIDWDPIVTALKNKLLLPILGDQYGIELEAGRLQLRHDSGSFWLQYYDRNLPLNPRSVRKILRHGLEGLEEEMGSSDPHLLELRSILFQLEQTPAYTETDPKLIEDRHRETRVARERLASLVGNCARISRHVEDNVRIFNGRPGEPSSFLLLHELLEDQAYRLAYWRTATHEINYRRFFDINELAGIRMEDDSVFDAAHTLTLRLIREGLVNGLRLDHVDGLFDPAGYFEKLVKSAGDPRAPIYLVVEKILSPGERLRENWMVHGTTGYEFLNLLNGLFVDGRTASRMRKIYERFVGQRDSFPDIVYESKKLIISTAMASELNVLADELNRLSEWNWRTRDFTLDSLQEALREVVACFPVYRTYVEAAGATEFDHREIDAAVRRALRRNPAFENTIFDFIRETLQAAPKEAFTSSENERRVRFALKFQQYTGPVQAKGLEDTAFYRYGPLISLNEVGGGPFRFGISPAEFHQANQERLSGWPWAMLTTATHDTKRGEDARARLNVLSEIPDQFRAELSHWARLNAGKKTMVHRQPAPDRTDEYFFYQTLLGAWESPSGQEPRPEFVERIRGCLVKAVREAKVHTSWIHPSEDYEQAVLNFVDACLTGPRSRRFLERFAAFHQRLALLGMVNSLAQVILKIASPGVPDFYQGTELWSFSLVDPDNRRPVDFEMRRTFLTAMEEMLSGELPPSEMAERAREMLANWRDGRIKLLVTAAGLRLRRRLPRLFLEGEYEPLAAAGQRADNIVAFARRFQDQAAIVIAPRLVASLTAAGHALPLGPEVWGDTVLELPASFSGRTLRDALSGRRIAAGPALPIAQALAICPVALYLLE